MAVGSQKSKAETMAQLTGLTHDIFVGDVANNVRRSSITSMMYQRAQPGDYRLVGQNMKFAVDLRYKTGGLATDGNIPDHVGLDAIQGTLTPVRRYARIALDNFVEKRAAGEGAFDDLADRIFDKLWDAWESMEIRHAIGPSSGLVAKIGARTSSTVVVLKDGYGHALTNPLVNLSEGSVIGWYDVSAAGVGGAGRITATGINYSTKAVTLDSATTWEPSAMTAIDDLIFFATTNSSTADYFTLERNLAPNGTGTILDPDAAATTVFGISETDNGRWKPFRKASTTFDHLEVTEHFLQLGSKRGFDVTPQSDRAVTYPSVAAQLARSLMAFQQQAYTGDQLKGGYNLSGGSGNQEGDMPHAGLVVAGIPVYVDGFFYHDVFWTICTEKLYRINLGEDADFWAEDGSMWQRIADFDGKDAFVVDYIQQFCNHRGAMGALTGISTDLTADDFAASIPNY